MNVLRGATSWICLYLVGTLYFLSVGIVALAQVITADNIKQTAHEQGTYSKIVPAVLSSSTYSGSVAGTLPLQEPWVQDVANKAFPASDLEQKGNSLIDSSFAWLDGQTDKPDFSLDFSANKQQLATGTADYVTNRLSSLPRCSLQNLPSTVDPYRIECLPPGVNPSTVSRSVSSDIAGNENFLGNPVVSLDNLSGTSAANQTGTAIDNSLAQLDGLRTIYQQRGLLVWLLPLLTIILSAAGVVLAVNRSKALRRLAVSFLISAISLVILALGTTLLFSSLAQIAGIDAISKNVLLPVLTDLAKQTRLIYLVGAGIALVISIALFIARKRLRAPNRIPA